MSKPLSMNRLGVCVALGLGASVLSGWVDAVHAEWAAARRLAAMRLNPPTWDQPIGCSFSAPEPVPANPDLVAQTPRDWPREGWLDTSVKSKPATESAWLIYEFEPREWRLLSVTRTRRGWPWSSMEHLDLYDSGLISRSTPSDDESADDRAQTPGAASNPVEQRFLSGAVTAPNPLAPAKKYVLPINPVWPGFAYNALIYAGALWLLLASPTLLGVVTMRKRRRLRCGLCLACGYDLAGLDRCPECGALVVSKS